MEKLFAALTDSEGEKLKGLISKPASQFSELLVDRFNHPITVRTFQSLIPTANRCYLSNSFFYSKLRDENGEYNYDRVKKWTDGRRPEISG